MMLKLTFFVAISLIILNFSCFSQAFEKRIFNNSQNSFGMDVIETSDKNFVVAAYSIDKSNNKFFTIYKIGKNGALIWEKNYQGALVINEGTKFNIIEFNNEYIFSGWKPDSTNTSLESYLFAVDTSGKKLWSYTFDTGPQSEILDCILSHDGKTILLTGHSYNDSTGYDIYYSKFDPVNKKIIWEKSIKQHGFQYGVDLEKITRNQYLILINTFEGTNNGDITIYKINENGDTLRSYREGNINFERGDHILYDNKNIYISGSWSDTALTSGSIAYLWKLDSLGKKVLGEKLFYSIDDRNQKVIKGKNGELFYCSANSGSPSSTYLISLKYNGDTNWVKKINYPSYNLVSWDFIQASDSSLVLTGFLSNQTKGHFFIYKLNQEGNTFLKFNKSKNQIRIYPNPTTDYLHIEDEKRELKNPYLLKIVNSSGKTVRLINNFKRSKINISDLNPGHYFLIINDRKYHHSIPFQKVN